MTDQTSNTSRTPTSCGRKRKERSVGCCFQFTADHSRIICGRMRQDTSSTYPDGLNFYVTQGDELFSVKVKEERLGAACTLVVRNLLLQIFWVSLITEQYSSVLISVFTQWHCELHMHLTGKFLKDSTSI